MREPQLKRDTPACRAPCGKNRPACIRLRRYV